MRSPATVTELWACPLGCAEEPLASPPTTSSRSRPAPAGRSPKPMCAGNAWWASEGGVVDADGNAWFAWADCQTSSCKGTPAADYRVSETLAGTSQTRFADVATGDQGPDCPFSSGHPRHLRQPGRAQGTRGA